ncbi:chromatin assembly factor 1 subunit A, partial [Planoprotostelium fungivorum]
MGGAQRETQGHRRNMQLSHAFLLENTCGMLFDAGSDVSSTNLFHSLISSSASASNSDVGMDGIEFVGFDTLNVFSSGIRSTNLYLSPSCHTCDRIQPLNMVSVETNRKREREDESSDVLVKRRAVENTQTNDVSVVQTVVTSSEEDQHSHGESDKENSLKDRRIDGNGPVKVITNTSQPVTPMTAAERKLEAEKKRQERDAQREKAAAEKKAKQDEKEKKALEKKQKAEEKQKALELKAAEKEREEKRKEEEKQKKEDDRLKKMLEKEEERRVKEDAKKKKEEERKKKEEEAKQKEEEQRKKVEKQKAISSFFTIKIVPSPAKTVKSEDGMSRWYKPFDTTGKIMPPTRFSSLPQEDIDRQIRAGGADLTVSLKELIEKKSQKERGIKMQKEEMETVKVVSFDDVPQQNANLQRNKRMKLLRFHDNRRPSYWGTYSKLSKVIRGRRPFAKDETLLDYEVDSDDEWEEEPEDAEDLNKSEDEADDEAENSEEEDDFVVADGYFSCDEGIQEEGQEGQVSRQKKPIQEEGKGHTVRLTPVVYGVCFELKSDDPNYTLISKMTTRMNVAGPINLAKPFGEVMEVCGGDSVGTSGTPSKRCRRKFDMTEEQIVQIIQMTHGNHNSVANFVSTLSEKLSIPQNIIKQKVKEISIFERRPANPRVNASTLSFLNLQQLCYYVKDE